MYNKKNMKLNPAILLLLFLSIGQFINGQTKSYNGNFLTTNFQGIANYNFIEQNDKRVFNGKFVFNSTTKGFGITGSFVNDLKDGIWNITLTNVANTNGVLRTLISARVTGSFKEGNLNGDWSLSRTREIGSSNNGASEYYQYNLKLLSYLIDGNIPNTNKTTIINEKSFAKFNNNRFVGNFSYSVNNNKISVSGQFDNEGYFSGIWTVNYFQNGIQKTQIRSYQKGVLESIKNKDLSTGDISIEYDQSIEVKEFFQNYNSSGNYSKKGNEYYKLIETSESYADKSPFSDAFSIWYNNSSLSESAYIYEIKRGSNEIDYYPQRAIFLDEERTKKAFEEIAIANKKRENEKREVENARMLQEQKRKMEEEKIAIEKHEIELAKERLEIENRKREEQKLKEFEESDYGRIRKAIRIEFQAWLEKSQTESDKLYESRIKANAKSQFNIIVDKVIRERIQKRYAPKVFGKLESYDANTETALIRLYGDYNRIYSNDTLFVKMKNEDASKVLDALRKCDVFCGIAVVCNKVALIKNNYRLTEATILFVFGEISSRSIFGPYLNSLDFSLKKSGNRYILSSVYLDKNLQFESLNEGADGKFLYYDWKYSDQSNYDATLIQNLNFTIEDLNIVLPF